MREYEKNLLFLSILILTFLFIPNLKSEAVVVIEPCSIDYIYQSNDMVYPMCGGGIDPYKINIGSINSTTTFNHFLRFTNSTGMYNFTAPSDGYYKITFTSDADKAAFLSMELYEYSTNIIAEGNNNDIYNYEHNLNYIYLYNNNNYDLDIYLTAGHKYYIRVKNTLESNINFSIKIFRDDNNIKNKPISIDGKNASSEINYANDNDYYTFTSTCDCFAKFTSTDNLNGFLYDSNNKIISYDDRTDSSFSLFGRLFKDQKYTLRVQSDVIVNYTLNVTYNIGNEVPKNGLTEDWDHMIKFTYVGMSYSSEVMYFKDAESAKVYADGMILGDLSLSAKQTWILIGVDSAALIFSSKPAFVYISVAELLFRTYYSILQWQTTGWANEIYEAADLINGNMRVEFSVFTTQDGSPIYNLEITPWDGITIDSFDDYNDLISIIKA